MTKRSVAKLIAQFAQWLCPNLIAFPHPRQIFSRRGAGMDGGSDDLPFAGRLCHRVKRVGGTRSRIGFRIDHSVLATPANGPEPPFGGDR